VNKNRSISQPLNVMLCVYILFVVAAFIIDTPEEILSGLRMIITSSGVLITDYMAIGGIGATLVNSAVAGAFCVAIIKLLKVTPTGAIFMALWVTTGFAMFGKNICNMIPLMLGTWLYSKVKREPFANFIVVALMSSTVAPIVSSAGFHPYLHPAVGIPLGVFLGILAGFIFPVISAYTVRVHGGYALYNMGFAGGIISMFFISFAAAFGIRIESELYWRSGLNLPLAVLLYIISAGLIFTGFFSTGKFRPINYRELMKHTGRGAGDLYATYRESVYINMGVLCAAATTLMILIGADLNGPTLAGIFTVAGFAAFGKHPRNCTPVVAGALICTYINHWDFGSPSNTLAILFCTALAPIAGQFGWIWGIVAGVLHVNTIMHIGFLSGGVNLYNNGFAAGFVALILVPVISAFTSKKRRQEAKPESGKA